MMSLENFWKVIEQSWQDSPELDSKRMEALETNDEDLLEELMEDLEESILENYQKRLAQLSKEELTGFIHTLEERFYHIDRQEIHDYTDGSDDGFLYCRCFIIGMGRAYYDMIDKTPSKAYDMEAESFGFAAHDVYEKRFNAEFARNSQHCIESCSNTEKWDS